METNEKTMSCEEISEFRRLVTEDLEKEKGKVKRNINTLVLLAVMLLFAVVSFQITIIGIAFYAAIAGFAGYCIYSLKNSKKAIIFLSVALSVPMEFY
jgi:Ca2+/Na+ antiporter